LFKLETGEKLRAQRGQRLEKRREEKKPARALPPAGSTERHVRFPLPVVGGTIVLPRLPSIPPSKWKWGRTKLTGPERAKKWTEEKQERVESRKEEGRKRGEAWPGQGQFRNQFRVGYIPT
jgi:hypothetical protein